MTPQKTDPASQSSQLGTPLILDHVQPDAQHQERGGQQDHVEPDDPHVLDRVPPRRLAFLLAARPGGALTAPGHLADRLLRRLRPGGLRPGGSSGPRGRNVLGHGRRSEGARFPPRAGAPQVWQMTVFSVTSAPQLGHFISVDPFQQTAQEETSPVHYKTLPNRSSLGSHASRRLGHIDSTRPPPRVPLREAANATLGLPMLRNRPRSTFPDGDSVAQPLFDTTS